MLRLKEVRKSKGKTQSEVAKVVGISQNNYSYWENGKVKIDNNSLTKLANYFNVSIDYLLGNAELVQTQAIVPETVSPEKAKEIWLGTQSTATQMLINLVLQLDDFQKIRVSTFATTLLAEGSTS